jgi:2-keto-4-pentenoate hydratase/2-oxohepta-3-ene-1,7-dioic acid hydratase in catechol pathway
MKFISFTTGDKASYGCLLANGAVVDLPAAAPGLPPTMLGFIAAGQAALHQAAVLVAAPPAGATLTTFQLEAPIPRPAKNVFCIGRNYKEHVAEGYRARGQAVKLPEFPQFFTKPPTAVIGPDAPFVHDPALTQALDYEVELALIIGTAGTNIPEADALKHVFGYTILNDITARDLQRRHEQWFKGKGLDRSCPLGPYILTVDEVPDPNTLDLWLTVDGEERQRSTVGQMIFQIPTIISTLSAGLTLEPGDIIATGTPSGVGYAMEPPRLLHAGNVVECFVTGLGSLRTPIV